MPNRLPTAGIPTPAVRKSPMAQASAKPQIQVAMPGGGTVGMKDLGKKAPTMAPKPAPSQKSNAQYFADQKKFVASQKKK